MRRILISLTVFALLFIPQFAAADDVDDLKAAYDRSSELHQSTNPNNIEAYINGFYKEFIWVGAEVAFPYTLTKEQLKDSKNNFISRYEYREWIEGKTLYRVVGDYGYVCSYGTEVLKPKGSPEIISNQRVSLTFVKNSGKWLLHSGHVSLIPSGN